MDVCSLGRVTVSNQPANGEDVTSWSMPIRIVKNSTGHRANVRYGEKIKSVSLWRLPPGTGAPARNVEFVHQSLPRRCRAVLRATVHNRANDLSVGSYPSLVAKACAIFACSPPIANITPSSRATAIPLRGVATALPQTTRPFADRKHPRSRRCARAYRCARRSHRVSVVGNESHMIAADGNGARDV